MADQEELGAMPRASDYEAMKEIVFPELPEEPKILEDVVHTWTIESWRSMSKKEHGPVFHIADYPWRILLFPHGNNVDQTSIYLEHGFDPLAMPENWSCCVQFALVLWNPNDPTIYHFHTAHHRFTKDESDWGFTRFLELRKMFNVPWEGHTRPICENESANVSAYARIVEDETGVLWHSWANYDSKKETGFVGLRNQGATCYLNSLLQSLFCTNAFRKAIYNIPTEDDPETTNSVYTLQRLFYFLQTFNQAVPTNELTKSFGWETRHIFEQQDVQEFSRKLMERMEERMKGTSDEKALPEIFSGEVKTYVSCIDVDYESSRVEAFWDVQLNVKGMKNLQESLQDYIQVEKLEGDNRYFAGEEHKLQDANKGVIFMSFPQVLHLQLKRFEYDVNKDQMTKINDRYEFPVDFDASPYLAAEIDRSESWEYQLHGVLVHSGDLNAGHYYAFLKPGKEGWFYRYDDEKVAKVTMREIFDEGFGGEYRSPTPRLKGGAVQAKKAPVMRHNSAYMLVYIRKSRLDKILCPITEEDIPQHLRSRFEDETAEKERRRKERDEAHLYSTVRVITNDTFRNHDGSDLACFDTPVETGSESENGAPLQFRLLKSTPYADFVAHVAQAIGTDPRRLRFWSMVNRQNRTTRPDAPIPEANHQTVGDLPKSTQGREPSIRLWAEAAEEVNADGEAIWPTYQSQLNGMIVKNDLILLFLKSFDIYKQQLNGVGHIYISKEKKVQEILPVIMERMGWGQELPANEKLLLWEEIKPVMIEPVDTSNSIKGAELQDGDIVCFQRVQDVKLDWDLLDKQFGLSKYKQGRQLEIYKEAPEYYDFLVNKKKIRFQAHPTKCDPTKYPDFELTMNSKVGYDSLAARVGEWLGIQPTHIRFWTTNSASGNPKAAVKRNAANPPTLGAILNPHPIPHYVPPVTVQRLPTVENIFFEVLEMSLAELDETRNIKITWLSEGLTKETCVDLFVPKAGTIEDVIGALIRKVGIESEADGGPIRIYEASNNKWFKEDARDVKVQNLNEYTTLYAERIPEDEIESPENHFIECFHFNGEPNKSHGIPFRFLVKEDEAFLETKKRLEKRTGLKGKPWDKVKFALVRRSAFSKPQYLNDSDVIWNITSSDDEFLGLDHPDRTKLLRNGIGDLFLR